MSLLDRLSLSRKFLVLGLIALMLAAIPTFLHIQKLRQDIYVARQEVRGFAPLMALQRVVQFAQQHRGLSSGMLSGNDAMRQRRPSVRDAVNQAITNVDKELAQAEASAALSAHWATLKQNWAEVEKKVAAEQWSAADSTKNHTRWITALLDLNNELMDEFGLSLDSYMDTYDLMQVSFVNVPALTEKVGIVRALGSNYLTKQELPLFNKGSLIGLRDRLDEIYQNLLTQANHSMHLNPEFKGALSDSLATMTNKVDKSIQTIDQQLIQASVLNYPATQYFDELTQSIDSIYQFSGTAMHAMKKELEQRVTVLERGILWVLLLQLLGFVVAGWLAWIFVRSITVPIEQAVRVATAVSQGDLTVDCPKGRGTNEISRLMDALSTMRAQLAVLVAMVRDDAENVARATTEMAQGNLELSARTEQEASALVQTAASMDQLNSHVKQNADHAREADVLAHQASRVAVEGGEVVGQVVNTMREINDSSKRISDIIGVIDGIAFQTNILALNASVEAARAGEQGRGFAVVANEVRSLAGRSAEAAKQIKELITNSVSRVQQGSEQVNKAGHTMGDVVAAIERVTLLMADINSATSAQSISVSEVGQAVHLLDGTTQRNAALVEQSAAVAATLRSQAEQLVAAVAVFKT